MDHAARGTAGGFEPGLLALGVRRRLESLLRRSARSAAGPAPAKERLVIVGNGMVGQRLCERLVEQRATERYRITVLGEEPLPAYDRVHLSDLFRGRSAADLVLRDQAWYREHDIELCLGVRAVGVDRGVRQVKSDGGRSFAYDRLVLATGSRATVPRVTVENGAEVIGYRTLEDAERVLVSVRSSQTERAPVVLIGGGLLGIEAARAFQRLGRRALVLEASSQLMPRQLDPEAAQKLLETLRRAGLEVRLRCRIERVERSGQELFVVLAGGERVAAGAVVAAAGVRPCDEVAREAGLRCHPEGGVEVDAQLRSSDPSIFAVGECASHRDVPKGLVAPGYAMADVLAQNLVGRRSKLGPQAAVTRLKLDVTEVTVLGDPVRAASDHDLTHTTVDAYRRLLIRERRVVAAIVVGSWDELQALQSAVSRGKKLPPAMLRRFEREGRLGLDTRKSLRVLPSTAVICQCANVTHGALRSAIAAGANGVEALSLATGAGSLCGTCRPELAKLFGADAPVEPKTKLFPAIGALALIACVLTLVFAPVPIRQSVLEQGFDRLFFDPKLKQISGYSLVALLACGLVFSLRKRWPRFRFSSYARLRVWHGVLGTLAIGGLFLHTGFRFGHNLNLALMLVFLTSAVSGGLSAIATSMQHDRVRRLAGVCRRVHELTFWPLPVLVLFHALKGYYF